MARFSAGIALNELGRPDDDENLNFKIIMFNFDGYPSSGVDRIPTGPEVAEIGLPKFG